MLRGYGTIETENTREGTMPVQTKACLDLSEYTRILLRCVIYYNSSRVISFHREPQMISDGVQPTSSNIWEWMVKKGRVNLISANANDIFLMLLPRADASITRQGLAFNGLHYDSDELDMFCAWRKEVDLKNLYEQEGKSLYTKVKHLFREDEGKKILDILSSKDQNVHMNDRKTAMRLLIKLAEGEENTEAYMERIDCEASPCDMSSIYHIIRLQLCESPCQGQSCCNCCGKAPALHLVGADYFPFQRWDDGSCCRQSREKKPGECMHLRGLLRREWLNREKNKL